MEIKDNKINLTEYHNLKDTRERALICYKAKEIMQTKGCEGNKRSLCLFCDDDMDRLLENTWKGYLGEQIVLSQLISRHPDDGWHMNGEHGYLYLTHKPNNEVDLIDNMNDTVEVKATEIYHDDGDYAYLFAFDYLKTFEAIWDRTFHNPTLVVVVDIYYNTLLIINREEFINKAMVVGNWNGSHKIKVRGDLIKI